MGVVIIVAIIVAVLLLILVLTTNQPTRCDHDQPIHPIHEQPTQCEHELTNDDEKVVKPICELDRLISEYKETRNPVVLIEIGDLWHTGVYPIMASNHSKSHKYYEMASASNNHDVKAIAIAKLNDDPIPEFDDDGDTLDDIDDMDLWEYELEDDDANVFLDDRQNVHDSCVTKTTKKNIEKLKSMVGNSCTRIASSDVKSILLTKMRDYEGLDYEKISEVIYAFSDDVKQFGCTELQSLCLVYAYIKDDDDLMRNLYLNLADCYENGHMVCTTGKISRVVSVVSNSCTRTVVDSFDDVKNIYYITRELEQLASKVRDDVMKDATEGQTVDYNNGSSDELTNKMETLYRERVRDQYVDGLGMDYSTLGPIMDVNIAMF